VLFTGNTDPNTDATINGVEIKTDENGYFQLEMDLVEGENTFRIVHKGKTVTYQITRVTEVVREVSPAEGVLNADGSTKLTVTAVAYAQARVYAVLNGTTISMQPAETEDDEYRDTAYRRFTGVYTVPDATTAVQNLGAIVVYGEWDGLKKSKTGATVRVNVKALPSDGKPIVVTSDWAETFPSSTVSHYSDPTYLPLPKGALDYAIGSEIRYTITEENRLKTFSFYRLQSGLRVLTDDIATVGTGPSGNRISGCTVTSDARHTKVILATRQQVSYTARYTAEAITVQFHYTESLPDGMQLSKNPLFSQVSFKGDTMTLTLKNRGKFLGYTAYYDDGGNLVLRFNNPPAASGKNLNGAKIVIDPGHGGNDPGALGYLASHPEKVVNYSVASKLSKILSSRGADVVLLNTYYNNLSLAQRLQQTVDADPHLFVSVHANSSAYSPSAAGSEAYYFNYFSSAFAQYASANLAKALGTSNRGAKFGYYYVTRSMQYPAILVETGFMSNRTEYHKLIDGGYQDNLAYGIADAIGSYFAYMGTAGTLTGTQTSGSSVQEASAAQQTQAVQTGAAEASADGLTLSDTALVLSVDDETQIWADWDGGEDDEIEWIAAGDEDVAELMADGNMIEIYALNPGSLTITARVKGNPSVQASCTVTVEE
jgi:N-acetylmuramoyl-L-alanine amidase